MPIAFCYNCRIFGAQNSSAQVMKGTRHGPNQGVLSRGRRAVVAGPSPHRERLADGSRRANVLSPNGLGWAIAHGCQWPVDDRRSRSPGIRRGRYGHRVPGVPPRPPAADAAGSTLQGMRQRRATAGNPGIGRIRDERVGPWNRSIRGPKSVPLRIPKSKVLVFMTEILSDVLHERIL
jgi:hypothetical protein